MRFVVAFILAAVVSVVSSRTDACQYIRTSMFALATSADLIVVVKAGKLADDGTQEMFPTEAIKHSGRMPTSLRLKTNAMCDVSFDEGKTYLVLLNNKLEVLGLGNGKAIAPSAALIAAMERWGTIKANKRVATLRQFTKSKDSKVAEEAKILLATSTPTRTKK